MDYFDYFTVRLKATVLLPSNYDRQRRLVLYPFGKQGLLLKQILNWQYGIEEAFILDDKLCKTNPDIKPLSYLEQIDTSQYTFIITSDNLNYWDELRQNIRMYVKEEYIIDMYASKPLRYSETRIASLEMAAREIYARKIGGYVPKQGCIKVDLLLILMNFFRIKSYIFLIHLRDSQIKMLR